MGGFAFAKSEITGANDSPLKSADNERVRWAGDGGAPTTGGMSGKDAILNWNSGYPDPQQILTGTELAVNNLPE